jgi:hypothetical protein
MQGRGTVVISPFALRDLGLLVKLQKDHVSLCPIETLTRPQSPMWAAIASLLPFDEAKSLTYILHEKRQEDTQVGFLQARQSPGQPTLHIQRLTPPLDRGEDAQAAWSRMINYTVGAAGERGIQRIFSCAGNGSPERAVLSAAGFSLYAREDIFRLDAAPRDQAPAPDGIRPEQSSDQIGINLLYTEITPHLVQQAEYPIGIGTDWLCGSVGWNQGEGFVLEDRVGIAGYGYLISGRIGHWLRIFVHARAYNRASDLVDYAMALLNYYPPLPVYCGVREYQGGVRAPLEERGFQMFSAQCRLVRHTMARVKEPARGLVPALEKRVEAPTTTVSPTERT